MEHEAPRLPDARYPDGPADRGTQSGSACPSLSAELVEALERARLEIGEMQVDEVLTVELVAAARDLVDTPGLEPREIVDGLTSLIVRAIIRKAVALVVAQVLDARPVSTEEAADA